LALEAEVQVQDRIEAAEVVVVVLIQKQATYLSQPERL
jgi:hypothetical protein